MEQEVVLDVKVKNQSLKQQLREAVLEAQALQERFGATSAEAINAAKRVANIKEEISDMNQVFKVFNPEEKFNAVIGVAQGIAGGFQAVTGAMQLFGTESEAVEKALLKVQAASAFAEGLNNIRSLGDSFSNLKLLVGDAIKQLGVMKSALIATGIGAFSIALGYVAQNWDVIGEKLGLVNKKQDALNSTLEDYKKAALEATTVINDVGNAFELAKEGVISKEDALRTYNEKLGDSLGVAKNINEAEDIYIKKKDAYIQAVALRAQANVLFSKAAEEQVKAQTAGLETQVSTWDYIKASFANAFGGLSAASESLINSQVENTNKIVDDSKQKGNTLNQLAKDLLKQADNIDKEYNIISDKNTAERKKKEADQAQKDFEERKKKNIEFQKELEEGSIAIEAARLKAEDDRKERLKKQKEDNEKAAIEAMKKQVELNDAIAKSDAENAQRRIDNQIMIRNATIEVAQSTLNGLVSIAEMGIKNEKKLEKFRKAAALVQIGIDTAKAISSTVDMAAKFAGKTGNPAMLAVTIAAGIATVLANMAKAKQILSASGSSGSAPSLSTAAIPTSTSAGIAGGGVTMEQGPAQQGQTIANANLINNAMNNQNMIRAVVVETDITDSQRRVRGIEDRATFG